jgi:hypothetical protein
MQPATVITGFSGVPILRFQLPPAKLGDHASGGHSAYWPFQPFHSMQEDDSQALMAAPTRRASIYLQAWC